jgi:isopentenyl diphosphate isomerase/L-lactate dehydrogenase-like FMN-dependent dehydrogenase
LTALRMKAARALNIEDLRRIARSRLPRVVYDFLEGGSEDGLTLKANREVFESIRFAPRTLVDVSKRTQKVSLFGRIYESPIGIAPIGAAGLFWHEGDVALARAARSANLPFVLSTHSFVPLERLAWESGGPPWFQLYLPREREAARVMVRRALQAGCEALVLTSDVPVGGNREYNQRNGFSLPLRLEPHKVIDVLMHPRWLSCVFARAWLARDNPMHLPEWATRRDHHSWQDFAWLRDAWPHRLFVKGILSVEDAQLAAEHGADGIFVSNHGGRQLDGVPSPMEALPAIAAAVGERLAIMVDSGFRRGTDIVKALAMGADMVFIGRAAIYGAAAGGEAGVRRAIQLLRAEIDRVLALLGCSSIEELGPQHVRMQPREAAPVLPLPLPRLRTA